MTAVAHVPTQLYVPIYLSVISWIQQGFELLFNYYIYTCFVIITLFLDKYLSDRFQLFARAGHLRYFCKFLIMKNDIFFIFYQVTLVKGGLVR